MYELVQALEADLGRQLSQSALTAAQLHQAQSPQRQPGESRTAGVALRTAFAQGNQVGEPLAPQGHNKAALRLAALSEMQQARSAVAAKHIAASNEFRSLSAKSKTLVRAATREQAIQHPHSTEGFQAADRRSASPGAGRLSGGTSRQRQVPAGVEDASHIGGGSKGFKSASSAENSAQSRQAMAGQRQHARTDTFQPATAAEADADRATAGLPQRKLQLPEGTTVPYDWSNVNSQQPAPAQTPPTGHAQQLGPNSYPIKLQDLQGNESPVQPSQVDRISDPGHLGAPGHPSKGLLKPGRNRFPVVSAAKAKASHSATGNVAEFDGSEGPQEFIPLAHGTTGEGSFAGRPGERLYLQDAKLKSRRAEKYGPFEPFVLLMLIVVGILPHVIGTCIMHLQI